MEVGGEEEDAEGEGGEDQLRQKSNNPNLNDEKKVQRLTQYVSFVETPDGVPT